MIEISIDADKVVVLGHAEYAQCGQDIVCAAVSALVTTFVASVEELTEDNIKADLTAGSAVIEYENLSKRSRVLLDSFLLGVEMIATEYPHHVRIERQ